jgi:hypothetical protein
MHRQACMIAHVTLRKVTWGSPQKNDEEFLTIKTSKAQRAVFFRGARGGQKDTPAIVLPVSI